MTNYIVETFYTCTFKIVHKLEKLNEKALSELEDRKDGKVEIIDVKLNNRKTKKINDDQYDSSLSKSQTKNISNIENAVNEKIIGSDKLKSSSDLEIESNNIQKFTKQINNRSKIL